MRRRLLECCQRAGYVHSSVSSGGWPTRRMHPCCAPVVPLDLARAGVYGGNDERMRRFVAKLRAGRPTTTIVIGGSISTIEYAGCTHRLPSGLNTGRQCKLRTVGNVTFCSFCKSFFSIQHWFYYQEWLQDLVHQIELTHGSLRWFSSAPGT